MSSPKVGGAVLSVTGTQRPRLLPSCVSILLAGVFMAWQWEERKEDTEVWAQGLDVAPSLLSLNWGPGLTLLQERSGMWSSHVPRKKRKAWALMRMSLSLPW